MGALYGLNTVKYNADTLPIHVGLVDIGYFPMVTSMK